MAGFYDKNGKKIQTPSQTRKNTAPLAHLHVDNVNSQNILEYDGIKFGTVTNRGLQAIQNNTLDSYTPATEEEKRAIRSYTAYKTNKETKAEEEKNKNGASALLGTNDKIAGYITDKYPLAVPTNPSSPKEETKTETTEDKYLVSNYTKEPVKVKVGNTLPDFAQMHNTAFGDVKVDTAPNATDTQVVDFMSKKTQPSKPKNTIWGNIGGVLLSVPYALEKAGAGALNAVEGVSDFLVASGARIIGSDMLGDVLFIPDSVSEKIRNFGGDLLESKNWGEKWSENVEKRYAVHDWTRSNVGVAFEGVGNLLPAIASEIYSASASPMGDMWLAKYIFGKSNKLATTANKVGNVANKVGKVVSPSDIIFGLGAAGQSASEGYRTSGDLSKSLDYGGASGLLEVAIERLSGGIAGTKYGKAILNYTTKSKPLSFILRTGGEAVEEVISTFVDTPLRRLTVDKDAEWADLKDYYESGKQGMYISLIMGVATYPFRNKQRKEAIKTLNIVTEELKSVAIDKNKIPSPLSENATIEDIQQRQKELQEIAKAYANQVVAETEIKETTQTNATTKTPTPTVVDSSTLNKGKVDVTPVATSDSVPAVTTPTETPTTIKVEETTPATNGITSTVNVGDVFTDTKNGDTIKIIGRDDTMTTMEFTDKDGNVAVSEFSNNSADMMSTNSRYTKVESAVKQEVSEAKATVEETETDSATKIGDTFAVNNGTGSVLKVIGRDDKFTTVEVNYNNGNKQTITLTNEYADKMKTNPKFSEIENTSVVEETAETVAKPNNTQANETTDDKIVGTTATDTISVKVGDTFVNTKGGTTLRVVSRDNANTTIEKTTKGGKVSTNVLTNSQAEAMLSNPQYQQVIDKVGAIETAKQKESTGTTPLSKSEINSIKKWDRFVYADNGDNILISDGRIVLSVTKEQFDQASAEYKNSHTKVAPQESNKISTGFDNYTKFDNWGNVTDTKSVPKDVIKGGLICVANNKGYLFSKTYYDHLKKHSSTISVVGNGGWDIGLVGYDESGNPAGVVLPIRNERQTIDGIEMYVGDNKNKSAPTQSEKSEPISREIESSKQTPTPTQKSNTEQNLGNTEVAKNSAKKPKTERSKKTASATDVFDVIAETKDHDGKYWSDEKIKKFYVDNPNLDFIERIYQGDKNAVKELKEMLSSISDVGMLEDLSWYVGETYKDKDYTHDAYFNYSYPYRGAVRKFRNAIKARINEIMTEKNHGTNLGIKNGKTTLAEVRSLFTKLNSNDSLTEFADKVFGLCEQLHLDISFVNQMLTDAKGLAVGDIIQYKTSFFNDTAVTDQDKAQTILHELIHSCTVYALSSSRDANAKRKFSSNPEIYQRLIDTARQLESIYNEIKYDADFKGEYGIKDVHEMVAELSNPAFIEKLQKKNLWDRIVDAICNLFGISRKTDAYSNVRACVDFLLENFDEGLYNSHAKTQRQSLKESGKGDGHYSFSSIANTFFGDPKMTAKEFESGAYKQTEGYKNYVDKCLNIFVQTHNVSKAEAQKEIESSIDGIVQVALASKKAGYDIFDDDSKRSKKDSKNRLLFSSLEPNSDYFTSSDISTICDKRQNFADIYDAIVKKEEALGVPNDKRFFNNVDNYFYIHGLMAEMGLTTPCRQCYVESMRKNLAPMAKNFLKLIGETNAENKANDQLYHQSGKDKGKLKTNNAELREDVLEKLADYGMSASDLTIATLSTEDGLARLKLQAPLIYEAFNSFYGQSKPKMPKSATPFRFGELTALLTDDKGKIKQKLIDKINSTGGFRLQSYSDFQIQNYVDVLQTIFEAGVLGLSGHAYTKVPAFLTATEGTNLKRNLSIFMYKDGSEWKVDLGDSFPETLDGMYDIVANDELGNTGIIAVSQNEDMSAWIMANDNVGYGIPFHKSGMKMDTVRATEVKTEDGRIVKGYKDIKDHTRQQTEVWAKTTADHKANTKVKKGIDIYSFWDFDNKDNLSKNDLIKKNLMAYIDACETAGYLPKFREYVMFNGKVLNATLKYAKELGFVSQNATVDDISFKYKGYTIPYGYYKFLGDFGMFTPDGKASPISQLSLKNYDFDKAVEFFDDSESLRRNEILQQFANDGERQRMRDSNLSTEELSEVVRQRRDKVADEIVSRGETKLSISEDESTNERNSLLSGDSRRTGDESTREQVEGLSETERKRTAEEIISKGHTEEKVVGKVKLNFVKAEAYNDDMKSIIKSNEEKGLNTHFFLGNGVYKWDAQKRILVDGMIDGNDVYLRYDGKFTPQTLNLHENVHSTWDTEKTQKAKNKIWNSLSEAEQNAILNEERYKKYIEMYDGKTDRAIQEFVADVLAGMSTYTSRNTDTVNNYWSNSEIVDNFKVSEYTHSTDAGGYSLTNNPFLKDLTEEDWSNFYRSLGELERGMWFPKTSDGDYIFETDDKLIFTDGDYINPTINHIVTFEKLNSEEIEYGKEIIWNASTKGKNCKECCEIARTMLGKGTITETNPYSNRANRRSTDDTRKRGYSLGSAEKNAEVSDIDSDYLSAVEKGDTETAQRMVDKVAKENGYNTPKLYHGSGNFGFTTFRKGRIYATASSGVAMGYNRGRGLGRIRNASKKYIPNDGSVDTAIKNAENVLDVTYSKLTDKVKNDIMSKANEIFAEVSTKIGELDDAINRAEHTAFWEYIEEKYGADKTLEYTNVFQNLAYMLSGDMTAEEILENSEWFKSDIARYHERMQIFKEFFLEEYDKIKGTSFYPLYRYLNGYDFGDALIDLEFGLYRLTDDREKLITTRDSVMYLDEVIDSIEAVKDVGIYQLYGNVGNKPLVVDEGKVFWDAIPFKGQYRSTDYIANWAEENGYTSVLFKTVLDPSSGGSVNEYADEYVFFDSNQVKSADPVVYDDDSNVIPLSERFDSSKDDIRYSVSNYANTFYSYMAKVVDGIKQAKLGADSVVNMLRGKGVKSEEIKWSGIESWLEGKKSVTKEELQEFVAGSMLQIEEETLEDNDIPYTQEQTEKINEYESQRNEILEKLKDEWKKSIGTDLTLYNFANVESKVVDLLLDADVQIKRSTEAGKEMDEAKKQLRDMFANDDFGYDSEHQAYMYASRNPEDFMQSYELTDKEQAIFERFIRAKEAFKSVEGISKATQSHLLDIASSADTISRKINAIEVEHDLENSKHKPKWGEYKLDGGSNYRELVFKMPNSSYSNDAMRTHWGGEAEGVLAHARVQDIETKNGGMLFIEEIQSDWHNEGRTEGYSDEKKAEALRLEERNLKKKNRVERESIVESLSKLMEGKVDEPQVASKTIIDFAHQNSPLWEYEIKRFNIPAELVERVNNLGKDRQKAIQLSSEAYRLEQGIPDAPFKDNYHEYVLKRLIRMAVENGYDSIGWTTADIQSERWSEQYAEGYRIEYDQEMPKFLNKYGKKWGAKVGKDYVRTNEFRVTDLEERLEDIERDIEQYNDELADDPTEEYEIFIREGLDDLNKTAEEIRKALRGTEVWSMPITESMKDSVLYEGQPMYSLSAENDDSALDIHYSKSTEDMETKWDEALEKYGAIQKGEKPVRDIDVPRKRNSNEPISWFGRTALEAGITPNEVVDDFKREIMFGKMAHEVITDKKSEEKAIAKITRLGFEEAVKDWDTLVSNNKINKEDFVFGMVLYNQAVTNKDYKLAMKLISDLTVEASQSAQVLQSVRMLKKMSPDGTLYYLEKSVEKMNEEFREQLGDNFKDIEIDSELMKELYEAETTEERDEAIEKIEQNIADQIPSTLSDKWNAWRYLAMLGNIRTHARNIYGNMSNWAVRRVKNVLGAVLEKTIPAEQRTKSLTKSKESVAFAKEDAEVMRDILTGTGGKYEMANKIQQKRTIFKTKWLELIRRGNFDFLEAEDWWFLKDAYQDSLAQLITARHLDIEFLKSGTTEANEILNRVRAYAINEAKVATFRQVSELGNVINRTKRELTKSPHWGKKTAGVLLEGVMPFTNVPINIAKQGVAYSPYGLGKGIYKILWKVKKGDVTATEAIDDLSKGLTGTAIVALGVFLRAMGLIVAEPDEDDKKKDYDRMRGHQSYALQIGEHSYTIDWLTPTSLPLFVGVELQGLAKDEGLNGWDILNALTRIVDPMVELSVLQGVSDALNNAKYTEENPFVTVPVGMITSYLGQALPTLGGQITRLIDDKQRTVYIEKGEGFFNSQLQRFVQTQAKKIPFASKLLEPQIDAWGEEKTYGSIVERIIESTISPGYYSKITTTEVDEELHRLFEATGDNAVYPNSKTVKSFTENKKTYNLTAEQAREFAEVRGKKGLERIKELFDKEKYKTRWDDKKKLEKVKEAYDKAYDDAKEHILEKYFSE